MDIVKSISPMGLMDGAVSWMSFNMIHNTLNEVMERNMANNFTALFHATGCASMAGIYLLDNNPSLYHLLKKFSTGYFLYDTYHSAKYLKYPLSSMYIYHHLATINYLHHDPETFKTGQIMFWAELSNIPSYFVYYYLKKSKNTKKIKFLKQMQFCVYSFIRLPILSYYAYTVLKNSEKKTPALITLPVYFMGLLWSYSLWKKL